MNMSYEQLVAMRNVLEEVATERWRQHAKWGEQDWPSFATAAPTEEQLFDLEMCREAMKRAQDGRFPMSFHLILFEEFLEVITERDPAKLRAELIQVAAVAVQWVEKLDRESA